MEDKLRWIFKPFGAAVEKGGYLNVETNAGTLVFPVEAREEVEAAMGKSLEKFIGVCLAYGDLLEYVVDDCPVFVPIEEAYSNGRGSDKVFLDTAFGRPRSKTEI